MEDEYEVDEYYRTKNGEILKIVDLDEYGFLVDKFYYQIVKHSKNIIDLVEVGDYVNGYKVIGVTLDPAPSGKCVDIDCDKPSYESYLFEEQIYSIVTHEQFSQMEYKVETEE